MVVEYRPTQTEHFRDRMATVRKLEPDSDGDGEVHCGRGRPDEDTRTAVKRSGIAPWTYLSLTYILLVRCSSISGVPYASL